MSSPTFRDAVVRLYAIVAELESHYPGRPFTPDGHMVGSLGECLVADAYGLKLMAPSNWGFDALDDAGRKVEIKATQGNSVAFRSKPEYCIVVKLMRDGTFAEIYNGPGSLIWAHFEEGHRPTNGQFQISLSKLRAAQKNVPM